MPLFTGPGEATVWCLYKPGVKYKRIHSATYFADPKEQTIGVIMKQTRGPVNDKTEWKFHLLINQTIDIIS